MKRLPSLVIVCFTLIGLTAGFLASQILDTTQQPLQVAASQPQAQAGTVVVQVHSVLVLPTQTPTPTPTATPAPTGTPQNLCSLITPTVGTMCIQDAPPPAPTPTARTCYSDEAVAEEPCVMRGLTSWPTPTPEVGADASMNHSH